MPITERIKTFSHPLKSNTKISTFKKLLILALTPDFDNVLIHCRPLSTTMMATEMSTFRQTVLLRRLFPQERCPQNIE